MTLLVLTDGFSDLVRSRLAETLGPTWQKKLGYEVAPFDERRLLRAFADHADAFMKELRGERRRDYAQAIARSVKGSADALAHRRIELDYDQARRLADWVEELLSALGLERDAAQAREVKRALERAALDQSRREALPDATARDYDRLKELGSQFAHLRGELFHCTSHIEDDVALDMMYVEQGQELARRLRVEARQASELIGPEAVDATHVETDAALDYLRAAETAVRLGVVFPKRSARWQVFVERWEEARATALVTAARQRLLSGQAEHGPQAADDDQGE